MEAGKNFGVIGLEGWRDQPQAGCSVMKQKTGRQQIEKALSAIDGKFCGLLIGPIKNATDDLITGGRVGIKGHRLDEFPVSDAARFQHSMPILLIGAPQRGH